MIPAIGRQREIARLDHRIDDLYAHLERMDQTGTRGVAVLTTRVDGLVQDVADLKSDIKSIATDLKGDMRSIGTDVQAEMKVVKAGRLQIAIAIFAALVPVYAGVIFVVVTH